MSTSAELPWHAAFPIPRSSPEAISAEELLELLKKLPNSSKDYLVVDTRRTDFENGFIKGAINLPAHSFFPTLPGLVPVLSAYPRVIFHCNACTPGSRGQKVAGWYQDALDAQGITTSKAVILDGGIKGWLAQYGESEYTVPLPKSQS